MICGTKRKYTILTIGILPKTNDSALFFCRLESQVGFILRLKKLKIWIQSNPSLLGAMLAINSTDLQHFMAHTVIASAYLKSLKTDSDEGLMLH